MQVSSGGLMIDLVAILSMLAGAGSILLAAYIAYRIKDDVIFARETREKIETLQKEQKESAYVSNEIANLLYDLFDLWSSLRAYVHILSERGTVSDKLLESIEERLAETERHFQELGLFSHDAERRRSAQQALAAMYGNLDTLDIFQRIDRGDFGFKDDEISESISRLRRRIQVNPTIRSELWTGRKGGGAF